jgi:RNA polymerase sigma factor (sigma-70 family)
VLLTYGKGPDAEDLVQSAMARVFTKLDQFHGDRFGAWVNRIAINIMNDYFRSRRSRWNREVFSDRTDESPSNDLHPDETFDQHWVIDRLADHLAAIEITRRVPLALSLAHGYTAVEIADLLNIKVSAAKKRLQRGRTQLIGRLKDDPCFREAMSDWLAS